MSNNVPEESCVSAPATGVRFHCVRCGEELTDAASIQYSFGPVCRKLANAALAKTIPADVETARAAWATLDVAMLPAEALATHAKCSEALTAGTDDWRETVKRMVWVASTSEYTAVKEALCETITALGYTVLAAVARSEASPSKAEVTVNNGRVVLKAARNMAAVAAVKAIPGRRFNGADKTWSVPFAGLDALLAVVETFYPMSKVDAAALRAAVEAAKTEAVSKTATPAKVLATVTENADGSVTLKTPYNGEFVADLKTSVPWTARSWDGANRAWVVTREHAATARAIVEKHYPGNGVAVAA